MRRHDLVKRLLRLLMLVPLAAPLFFEGCGGSGAPKKTKDQPADMDMDKVPPAKP